MRGGRRGWWLVWALLTRKQRQVCEFLKKHTCYDLLPQSYKVIVFDTTLPVKKAFYAMLQNGTDRLAHNSE